MQQTWHLSTNSGCGLLNLSRSVYYYESKGFEDAALIERLNVLALAHPAWGFWKMFGRMRNEGLPWNHKRVYRVYTSLNMNIRRKSKRRLPTRDKQALEVPPGPNQVWGADFMADSLYDGRRFRVLNIIDHYNREALIMEADTSLPATRVVRALERLREQRGAPRAIRVDNGPEFLSNTFRLWCQQHQVQIEYIQPGKPVQNAFVERFNRSYRNELLDAWVFVTLREVQEMTEEWRRNYNSLRPHEALNNLAPWEFMKTKEKLTYNLS